MSLYYSGLAILAVCETLIYAHAAAVILEPLGDLLQLIWTSYGDIDVCDHGLWT